MLPNAEESAHGLPDAAARRLSNQINRAYCGTYGARTGLQTIVRSVTRQMLRGGSSPDAVSRAITHHVMTHSCTPADHPANAVSDTLRSRVQLELTEQCAADVALEAATA